MIRFKMWFFVITFLDTLAPVDRREDFLSNGLMLAAEDPALDVEYYALLLRTVDQLLGR